MEVMEARLIRASELNGEMDDEDTGHTDSITHTVYDADKQTEITDD